MRTFGGQAVVLGVVAGLASGCASLGAAQLANTNGAGQVQFGLEAGFADWDSFTFPRGDLALRYGITDQIDIGGKVGSSLVELNSKFQLTNPANDGFVLSLAPSVGGFIIGGPGAEAGLVNFALPLLLGIKVGDGHQLVIGPRLQDFLIEASAGATAASASALDNVLCAGGSVGFAIKINDFVRIMPEVSLVIPLVGTVSAAATGVGSGSLTGGLASSGALLGQFSLNLLVGTVNQHTGGPEGPPARPVAPPSGPVTPPPPPSNGPPALPPPPPPPGAPPSMPPPAQ